MKIDLITPDHRMILKNMVHGYTMSCAIFVCVQMNLANLLRGKKLPLKDLSIAAEAHLPSLERLFRVLALGGIVRQLDDGTFELTEVGTYLSSDHPQSMANEVQLFAGEETYLAWSRLKTSIQTGKQGFDAFFGGQLFSYLDKHPESALRFQRGWGEISDRLGRELVEKFDFHNASFVIDVGGGDGTVLGHILQAFTNVRGMVFDLAGSLVGTKRNLERMGVKYRWEMQSGDAMEGIPEGADLHIIKSVLHTLADEACVKVLSNSRRSLADGGRVLVIERLLDDSASHWAGVVDLTMLVMTGGKERSVAEFEAIFAQSGFELVSVVRTPSGFFALEGQIR